MSSNFTSISDNFNRSRTIRINAYDVDAAFMSL